MNPPAGLQGAPAPPPPPPPPPSLPHEPGEPEAAALSAPDADAAPDAGARAPSGNKGKAPKKVWDSKRYRCEHERRKYLCRDCGGSQICEHDKVRTSCKECKGGTICEHGRRRAFCKDCGGGAVCIHKVTTTPSRLAICRCRSRVRPGSLSPGRQRAWPPASRRCG
jgi:hypothetical protein